MVCFLWFVSWILSLFYKTNLEKSVPLHACVSPKLCLQLKTHLYTLHYFFQMSTWQSSQDLKNMVKVNLIKFLKTFFYCISHFDWPFYLLNDHARGIIWDFTHPLKNLMCYKTVVLISNPSSQFVLILPKFSIWFFFLWNSHFQLWLYEPFWYALFLFPPWLPSYLLLLKIQLIRNTWADHSIFLEHRQILLRDCILQSLLLLL